MENIKKQLLLIRDELEQKYEPLDRIIDRLKSEGESVGEIEEAVLNMNRLYGVRDSIERSLRILE